MTYVNTPRSGAASRGTRSRNFGAIVGAVVVTVAAAAAIATGIAVSQQEPVPAAPSIAPARPHGRVQSSSWDHPTTVDELMGNGSIPSPAGSGTFTESPGQPR